MKPSRVSLWIGAILAAASVRAETPSLTLQNGLLQVSWDQGPGRFHIQAANQARPFASDGRFAAGGGTAMILPVSDKIFGQGQAMDVRHPDGSSDQILVFPNPPFVLFRPRLFNAGGEVTVKDKVRPLIAALDLGTPLDGLKVLGTGGLAPPDRAPGSYMWMAVAEPESRRGVVGGWITSQRGSGVVFAEVRDGRLTIEPQIDYGKLRLKPGQAETLETFALGCFDDARLGMEAWADAVAKVHQVHLPPQPAGYCTWYHAGASDEKRLAEQAAFAARNLKPFGFSFVQIDDGWQDGIKTNGPRKNFSLPRDGGPYASGMKATADRISVLGLVPGLWWMPFAGNYQDPWFEKHQDWFVHREDGKPFDVRWGGTCLDMTHPEVQAYVRDNARRMARDWGYQYFKMDGLWMGSGTEMEYVNDAYKDDRIGNAMFRDRDKTNIEVFRSGLRLIRESAGPGVFLLGCNTAQNMRSYGGAFGLLDAMRIGPDNGPSWNRLLRGPAYGARNYHLHGRVWYNDPDPLYVREKLPLNQARMIASWVTLSGQLSVSSDGYAELPPERLDLLKQTLPSHGLTARPADLFDEDIPRIWVVSDQRRSLRRDVVGLFNWGTEPAGFDEALARLGLDSKAESMAFEYWTNRLVGPFQGRLKLTLPPAVKKGKGKDPVPTDAANSCAVLSIVPITDHPRVISTSRHITQGIVDLVEENWNAPSCTLSGTSEVVGGDPYELRISTRSTAGEWALDDASLAMRDWTNSGPISTTAEPGLVRVTIRSSATCRVNWRLRFRRVLDFSAIRSPAVFKGDDHTAYRDPAAICYDGVFHLFFTLVRIEPDGKPYLYTARSLSRNLVDWTEPEILTPRDQKLNFSSPGNAIRYGDQWVLCLQTYPRPNGEKYGNSDSRIWITRSDDLVGWGPPEILKVKGPSVPREEMGRMIDPFLLKDKDDPGKWWCFFKQNGVSMSWSRDLKDWTFAGSAKAGENACVLVDGDEYVLFHSPPNGIGVKRSRDLKTWRDEGLLTLGQKDWPWARGRLTAGFVLDLRKTPGVGKAVMFFHGSAYPESDPRGGFDNRASLGIAWSEDLKHWTWPGDAR